MAVYDNVLLLLAVYHIVEWLKTTIVLTVVFVGINLMWIYLFLILNTLFGILVIIQTIWVCFSEDGEACAEA